MVIPAIEAKLGGKARLRVARKSRRRKKLEEKLKKGLSVPDDYE